ncbi:ABC transporter permease [Acetatifactor aquisgranensis]|uniref:ABC transporter permease n=1 Tax=Acetatifactor aquisgranensis TaxID=2941233 RepID=UPI00203D8EC6|nr:ABC transporter permease [Acetatifactor aquisgranensis]
MKNEYRPLNLFSLFGVEMLKIRRSGIFWILLIPAVMMWLPSAMNANVNFLVNPFDISPEHNYFIQGYMGLAWFMIPAMLIVCTVLLSQTEIRSRGLVKCLTLPVSTAKLCLAKFLVTIVLAAVQLVLSIATYYGSALLASKLYAYDFLLPLSYVCRCASLIYLAAVPAAAIYWMLSILIRTPIFSAGLGLASIVPSVLMLNTEIWYSYPPDYPFYILMTEYGRIAPDVFGAEIQLIPMLPIGICVTVFSLAIACARYGTAERNSDSL